MTRAAGDKQSNAIADLVAELHRLWDELEARDAVVRRVELNLTDRAMLVARIEEARRRLRALMEAT